jgi:hypothetical protein
MLNKLTNKKKGESMTTCYECGEDVIYPNDAFDVISKCSNEDCKTHKNKKRPEPFLHQEKRKLVDDLMNGIEERA